MVIIHRVEYGFCCKLLFFFVKYSQALDLIVADWRYKPMGDMNLESIRDEFEKMNLTDVQKEKLSQCGSTEEFMAFAESEKLELSDEMLDMVAGGGDVFDQIKILLRGPSTIIGGPRSGGGVHF